MSLSPNKDNQGPLTRAIEKTIEQARYRFHVPGHAGFAGLDSEEHGNEFLFQKDLTELPALDVLGNPSGVLKDSQELVSQLYGAKNSFYLINGASVGIMAALMASGSGEVLVARNCHRAVVHGLVLTGAKAQWLLPEYLSDWGLWGAVDPHQLDKALTEAPEINAFVMTHPTYEGIASDIAALQKICRKHNVLLIVDEAHGSLWPLSEHFPSSAIEAGADAVIHSMHKSGGSLTQTALLHLPKGSRLNAKTVQEALNMLQTTSPSYVLLENLETTCLFWRSDTGKKLLSQKLNAVTSFYAWAKKNLLTLELLESEPDKTSLACFIRSSKLSGEQLGNLLEETYHLAYEAITPVGVLMCLNIGLPEEALDALKTALFEIDHNSKTLPDNKASAINFSLPRMAMTCREAFFSPGTVCLREDSEGRISRQVVATCPPGIPVLIPGEVIEKAHLPYLPETVIVLPEEDYYRLIPPERPIKTL